MSAPLIFIIIPGILAILLFAFRRWKIATAILGLIVTFILVFLAYALQFGVPIPFPIFPGAQPLQIDEQLFILGRSLTLGNDARLQIIMIYGSLAFWFGGVLIAQADRSFVPISLGIAALLTAAISVQPFLYAALLIELAVLASVPLLAPPGSNQQRGTLRLLIFQTLGMPFILVAGWFLSGIEVDPANTNLILQVFAVMGLGFALLMAIFPFHNWIPILAQEAHPYATAFLLYFLPQAGAFFLLSILMRYIWLSEIDIIYQTLNIMGAVMVALAGIWAAFQRHLGRIMGFAAMVEIGFSLLALSMVRVEGPSQPANDPTFSNLAIFFMLFLPRILSLALWGLALVILQDGYNGLTYFAARGAARRFPIAAISLLAAQFSIAGFPLLAGFPSRIALWSLLVQQSLPAALMALAGLAGLLLSGVRTLAVFVTPQENVNWEISETRSQRVLLIIGLIIIFLIGLLP